MRRLWRLLLVGLLAVGCSAPVVTPGAAPGEPAAKLEGCLKESPKAPANARKALVERVVDGDTIKLGDGSTIRLVGVNTPESVDPRRPVQAYGKEASAFLKELVEGREILLQEGRTPTDKYGRTLAWVWLPDGRFLNAFLVQAGFAQVYTYSDNPDHAEHLLACQREARDGERGLWALPDGKLTLVKEPGTVGPDGMVSVTAKAAPGASCTILVEFKSGPSKAKGLEPKQADAQGMVSWSWKIASNAAAGIWPVEVNCGGDIGRTSVTVP